MNIYKITTNLNTHFVLVDTIAEALSLFYQYRDTEGIGIYREEISAIEATQGTVITKDGIL